MRARWLLALVLLVPGGLLALAVLLAVRARSRLAAMRVQADLPVLFWSRFWCAVYRVPWALHLAILSNEGASVAKDGRYPLGDLTASRGPALGPGQVLRSRVERLWTRGRRRTFRGGDWDDRATDTYTPFSAPILWLVKAPRPLDYELVLFTRGSVWASVAILREALDETGGDLRAAARRYNGFGAPADAYAARAMERIGGLT